MNSVTRLRLPVLAVAAVALAGCDVGLQRVESQWISSIGRYGMAALYPPSEDLQPGDILLDVPAGPRDSANAPRMQRLGSIDRSRLLTAIQEQEAGRLRLAHTPPPTASSAGGGSSNSAPAAASQQASINASAPASSALNITANIRPPPARASTTTPPPRRETPPVPLPAHVGNPQFRQNLDTRSDQQRTNEQALLDRQQQQPRLRRNVLPATTAAVTTAASLGAAGPLGGFLTMIGLSGLFSEAVHIRLGEVETLGLDSLPALRLLEEQRFTWIEANGLTPLRLLQLLQGANEDRAKRLCRGEARRSVDEPAYIHIVRQVIYTHSIEYEFVEQSAFAMRGQAQVAPPGSNTGAVPSVNPLPAAALGGGGVQSASDALARSQANLTAAQERANQVPQRAGVTTSFGIGRFGGLTMNERTDQPLAVGFLPVQSYSVQGSLLALAPSQQEADRRLDSVRQWCADLLAEASEATSLAPVEALICDNSRFVRALYATSSVAPARCATTPRNPDSRVIPNEAGRSFRPNLSRLRSL